MPRTRSTKQIKNRRLEREKLIEQHDHKGKERINNSPVGLVTSETDAEWTRKTYAFDPHLDPQLMWTSNAEHTSFEVPTIPPARSRTDRSPQHRRGSASLKHHCRSRWLANCDYRQGM